MQPALAYAIDSGHASGTIAWNLYQTRDPKQTYSIEPQFAIVPRSIAQTTITNGYSVPFVDTGSSGSGSSNTGGGSGSGGSNTGTTSNTGSSNSNNTNTGIVVQSGSINYANIPLGVWYELPNTRMQSVIGSGSYLAAVV